MATRFTCGTGAALLAVALVFLTPLPSTAQRGGGGHGGGGHAGGMAHGGMAHAGGHPGNFHGGNFHGGNFRGVGFGYPFYGYGLGYGLGYGGYGLGLGYGGYGYGGYNGYGYNGGYGYGLPYFAPAYGYPGPSGPPQRNYPPDPGAGQPSSDGSAGIQVIVPADAEIWFDGSPTTQRGAAREFQTPALPPNQTFTYTIRARWNQDGQVVTQERSVQVRSGRQTFVDFTAPQK